MKDIIDTIYKTSRERIANPIIGSFILSWLVFNWRPLAFFYLSNKKVEEKILYINDNFCSLSKLLRGPLVLVGVYMIAIPYISLLFDLIVELQQRKRNEITVRTIFSVKVRRIKRLDFIFS